MSEEHLCDLTKASGDKIKRDMPDDDFFFHLADFFKIFGDSTRIKIIFALTKGEMCVGEIAELLNMTQSSISHQLRTLKAGRLAKVKVRKKGKHVFYSLDDMYVRKIYEMGLERLKENRRLYD